jgi:hypothetical protein
VFLFWHSWQGQWINPLKQRQSQVWHKCHKLRTVLIVLIKWTLTFYQQAESSSRALNVNHQEDYDVKIQGKYIWKNVTSWPHNAPRPTYAACSSHSELHVGSSNKPHLRLPLSYFLWRLVIGNSTTSLPPVARTSRSSQPSRPVRFASWRTTYLARYIHRITPRGCSLNHDSSWNRQRLSMR